MAGSDMLQVLMTALQRWQSHIERCTHSTLIFQKEADGFSALASWPETKAGPAGSHRIHFTREFVLGPTASAPWLQQRLKRKTCFYRDDVIRQVLEARKV